MRIRKECLAPKDIEGCIERMRSEAQRLRRKVERGEAFYRFRQPCYERKKRHLVHLEQVVIPAYEEAKASLLRSEAAL